MGDQIADGLGYTPREVSEHCSIKADRGNFSYLYKKSGDFAYRGSRVGVWGHNTYYTNIPPG